MDRIAAPVDSAHGFHGPYDLCFPFFIFDFVPFLSLSGCAKLGNREFFFFFFVKSVLAVSLRLWRENPATVRVLLCWFLESRTLERKHAPITSNPG